LEAESKICDILLLVLKIMTEELYVVSISNPSFVNLSSRKIFFWRRLKKRLCVVTLLCLDWA